MKFVALFVGAATAAEKAEFSEAQSARLIADWGAWMEKHNAAIVDGGSPLGTTLRVSAGGIAPYGNAYVSYAIVEANSLEEAARMFTDHPHLGLHPGNAVEVMTCPELPAP